MSKPIENRNELLFLYDAKDVNPNGDPFENKPRIDDETGLNIVTDTRLKRTIRDYLESFRKEPIFISIARKENGDLKSREERLKEIKVTRDDKEKIFRQYIDLRLFGATIAVGETSSDESQRSKKERGWSVTKIGPVQLNIGRSLNRVKVETIKGTTVMPSEEGKTQGTFTETSIVHYSLICFHGIVNEHAAAQTNMSEEDLSLLFEALWNGTKNLITRSKVGQEPRLLLRVVYKNKEYHIGDLHKLISAKFSTDELSVRDIKEVSLDVSELISTLLLNADKIGKIQIKIDPRLSTVPNIKDAIEGKIPVKEFDF